MKSKRTRLVVGSVLITGLVFIAVNAFQKATTDDGPSPGDRNTAVLPTPTPSPGEQLRTEDGGAAVRAAMTSISQMSGASLMPASEQKKYVNEIVAPANRAEVLRAMIASGESLAAYMGYSSVALAALSSGYTELPQLYRIDKLTAKSASVSMFVQARWKDATGRQFALPTISVVHLVKTSDGWRFNRLVAAPRGSQPTLTHGLTYAQATELFQPFLKGYSDVQDLAVQAD